MKKRLNVFIIHFICAMLIMSGCGKIGNEKTIKTESIGLERRVDDNLYAVYNKMRVHYIGNVQGACTFIELGNGQTMLMVNAYEQDYSKIIEYLKKLNYSILDYAVLTNMSTEGLNTLWNNFEVDKLYLPKESNLFKVLKSKDTEVYTIESGNILQSGPLSVDSFVFNKETLIRILYGETSFVFADTEERFIEEQLGDSEIDVLSICDVSDIENFIKKTSPRVVVTAYGDENKGNVYCTEEIGTVVITADTNKEIVVDKG